jgi:hypothetical protein
MFQSKPSTLLLDCTIFAPLDDKAKDDEDTLGFSELLELRATEELLRFISLLLEITLSLLLRGSSEELLSAYTITADVESLHAVSGSVASKIAEHTNFFMNLLFIYSS